MRLAPCGTGFGRHSSRIRAPEKQRPRRLCLHGGLAACQKFKRKTAQHCAKNRGRLAHFALDSKRGNRRCGFYQLSLGNAQQMARRANGVGKTKQLRARGVRSATHGFIRIRLGKSYGTTTRWPRTRCRVWCVACQTFGFCRF